MAIDFLFEDLKASKKHLENLGSKCINYYNH